jgi:hypothetical protein
VPEIENDDGMRITSGAETMKFFEDPTFVHFVGMLSPPRPGVIECFQDLEETHYPPGTQKNEQFLLAVIEWQDVTWGVAGIPLSDRPLMDATAAKHGLRVADGIPLAFSGGGAHWFPISNERVFTLENVPGHPVYNKPEEA